jgi:hypothetical protein
MPYFHSATLLQWQSGIDFRTQLAQTGQIIDPQSDSQSMFTGQLSGKSPADTYVSIVVYHCAENVTCNYFLYIHFNSPTGLKII